MLVVGSLADEPAESMQWETRRTRYCQEILDRHSRIDRVRSIMDDAKSLHETCVTRVRDDVPIHFQVVALSKQTFVWVGCGTPRLNTLSVATAVNQASGVETMCVLANSFQGRPGPSI